MLIKQIVDDFGGDGDAKRVEFSINSVMYVIDLNANNEQSLLEALKPFIVKARVKTRVNAAKSTGARAWAIENGLMSSSSRGGTPKRIVEQYEQQLTEAELAS